MQLYLQNSKKILWIYVIEYNRNEIKATEMKSIKAHEIKW